MFEVLTLMGAFLIASIAFKLWHPSVAYVTSDYVDFALNTFLIVAIWVECWRSMRGFEQLGERIGENALSSLSKHALSVGYFGYLVIYEVTFMHRH
jgi:hypothetical protein